MTWMVYGANGYTGALVARLAVARGEHPILAGRTEARVAPLAVELGLERRVFEAGSAAPLADVAVVANCAGPFAATAAPMLEACLATGTHYVDVCGEVEVLESMFGMDGRAADAGVVAVVAAGFDVVPRDCLAVMAVAALPDATRLEIAFGGLTRVSPGTLRTWVDALPLGGVVRIRRVPFPRRERRVAGVPMGDLITAYRSTGIASITTYAQLPVPAALVRWQRLLAPFRRPLRALTARVPGPGERTRARLGVEVWVEASTDDGRAVAMAMTGPEGYQLTADAVVRAVAAIQAGRARPGVLSPAMAFGPGFVAELDGVRVFKDA